MDTRRGPDRSSRVEIRRLASGQWETLRAVRLRALFDAPYAFGSTYDDESDYDEATWRERLDAQAWFIAIDANRPVGLSAGGQLREPDAKVRTLRSMWVDPTHRGRNVADALVAAVATWARTDGAESLTLWATEEAERARAFYVRVGFVPTGEEWPMESRPDVKMARYRLEL